VLHKPVFNTGNHLEPAKGTSFPGIVKKEKQEERQSLKVLSEKEDVGE
jgi:hypothetical protein